MDDKTFEALANEHRRRLLVTLLDADPLDVDIDPTIGERPELTERRERFIISMYHIHLPKLADYGYIRWERTVNNVTKGPQFEDIQPLLEFIKSNGTE